MRLLLWDGGYFPINLEFCVVGSVRTEGGEFPSHFQIFAGSRQFLYSLQREKEKTGSLLFSHHNVTSSSSIEKYILCIKLKCVFASKYFLDLMLNISIYPSIHPSIQADLRYHVQEGKNIICEATMALTFYPQNRNHLIWDSKWTSSQNIGTKFE